MTMSVLREPKGAMGEAQEDISPEVKDLVHSHSRGSMLVPPGKSYN